jgi:hypothetical protein
VLSTARLYVLETKAALRSQQLLLHRRTVLAIHSY